MALEAGVKVISHESIYRFIYGQMARKKDYAWRHYLPRAKSKQGWRGRSGGSPASFIQLRRPLAERPQDEADCLTPGHWEADLMLFRAYGQAVLTMHERHSRLCIAVRPGGKAAGPIASVMFQVLAPLPPRWRRTVTFDNGTEFARHYRLHACGIETFFCDMRSPWQKGGVENAIGRLRRGLPRQTDWASEPEERFTQLVQEYNNTPRKCLGNRTPAEIFAREVLHLKCESTWCFVPSMPLFAGCGRILADFLGHKIGHLLLKSGRKRPTVGDIYDVNWRRGRPHYWLYIYTRIKAASGFTTYYYTIPYTYYFAMTLLRV